MSSAPLHDELVLHATALRRLARDLLRDPHTADDIVQDAMCAAIEKPPRSAVSVGSWLKKVVARAAFDHRRSERRRRTREQVAAGAAGAGAPPTGEQVELQRSVLAAVQGLAEPYRTTVWQRYYENRSPREIAAATGEPVKTVKTRLARGLQKLRERLDAEHGSRRGWAALAAPLAVPLDPLSGVLLMSIPMKSISVGVVCVLSAAWWWFANDPTTAVVSTTTSLGAPASEAVATAPVDSLARESAAPDAGAFAATLEAARAALVGAEPDGSSPLGGLVIDVEGRPRAGIEITWDEARFDPPVRTGPDGRFRCRAGKSGRVGIASPGAVAVLVPTLYGELFGSGLGEAELRLDLTIVVAPWTKLAGTVVDTNGAPIPSAQVSVEHGVPLRTRIDRVLDRCVDAKFVAMTLGDGGFTLDAVPNVPSAKLTISARGHLASTLPVDEARHREQFVLRRVVEGDVLEGVVVDENDAIVPQAVVVLHDHSVVTESDGTFRFELWRVNELPKGQLPVLEVACSNRLPARVAALGAAWRTRGAWPVPLRIRVGGRAESIRGRVVRADGTPFADPWVTFVPPEPDQIRPTLFDGWAEPVVATTEHAVDAKRGEFETPRVVPGRYRLRVFHPTTLETFCTDEIPTGSNAVEIRAPDRGSWPALRGLVVDRRGAPVPGADWLFERDDPTPGAAERMHGSWQHASRDGVIEHPPVSRDVDTLCVKAAGMAEWVKVGLADVPRLGDFRVVVPVGCQTRIELGPQLANVDCAHVLDGNGAQSPVVFTNGDSAFGTRRIPIAERCSQTFQALDDCTTLVLCRGAEEIARFPITLRPGETNVLRW